MTHVAAHDSRTKGGWGAASLHNFTRGLIIDFPIMITHISDKPFACFHTCEWAPAFNSLSRLLRIRRPFILNISQDSSRLSQLKFRLSIYFDKFQKVLPVHTCTSDINNAGNAPKACNYFLDKIILKSHEARCYFWTLETFGCCNCSLKISNWEKYIQHNCSEKVLIFE